jgi:Concanavalin A-like lectin/glucanases superfamily/Putative Ig domain
MMLLIQPFLRLLRVRARCSAFVLVIMAATAYFRSTAADAQAVSNLFIFSFNPAVAKISTAPATRWGLFRQSDTVTISTTDNSTIRVLTENGLVVYLGPPTSLHLAGGHYFVECNGDRNQFAVLPDDYAGASFLSTEADNGGDSSLTVRLAAVNPSWVRAGEAMWANVEAQQGVFNWTAMDQTVAANAGRKIFAYIGDVTLPAWVNSNNFVATYTQFVQALANRYPNQLAYIEAWNEPWYNKFPNTTNLNTFVAFYLQLVAQARSAVKPINPAIQVIGPSWTSIVKDESLAMTNSIALFDGWSWHDYGRGLYAPDQEYGSPNFSPALETDHLIPYFGNFVTQKPLLVDELGLYGQSALGITNTTTDPLYRSNLDWYRGMCRTIKTVVMYRACGVEALSPHVLAQYAQPPDPNLELYGWDQSGTNSASPRGPHPKTSAFLMACYWLNGAMLVDYRTPGQQAFLYAWQLPNNTAIVFAWAAEGQTVSLLNSTLAATDLYGNSVTVSALTETPVLFRSNSLSAAALLINVLAALPPNLNLPPVLTPIGSQSISQGQPLQFTVSATDPNHYAVTYSAAPLPTGASFNPVTGVFSWTPTAGQLGAYPITFTAMDNPTTSASISVTVTVVGNLLDKLANYWKFDANAGTIAADSAGLAGGTLSNVPPSGWVAGKYGSALSFNGTNSFVALPSSALSFTNNFTVAAWVYPQNASGGGAFIAVRSYYQSSGFRFLINKNGVFVQGQTTAGWQFATFDAGAIQNNNWYHVAVVDDNSTILVYVNGVYVGSAYWGGNMIMNSNTFSRIGNDGTAGADYFSGVIDEVMLFTRTLGPSEITLLYQGVYQLPTPTITSLKLTGSNAVVSFTTVTSATYEVDSRNDLTTGTWLILTNGVSGTGGTLSNTDVGAVSHGKRFYRIVAHY